MWVEFVVGSCPCSKGFSLGSPVFLPPQKSTLLNSNSIWKQWMKSHFLEMPLQIPIYLFVLSIFSSWIGVHSISGSLSMFLNKIPKMFNFKARLHRRFLSRQLNAIFVAPKLQLQNRTCKPGAIFSAICPRNIAGFSNLFETCCNFSATKIAWSCRDKNRLCKRAFSEGLISKCLHLQFVPLESTCRDILSWD